MGGDVTDNSVKLYDSKIVGNQGGSGGSAGRGGATIFGGASLGAHGGNTTIVSSASGVNYRVGDASGGAGGDVSGNTVELYGTELKGGEGSAARDFNGGHGGGSVLGGFSNGGLAGFVGSRGDEVGSLQQQTAANGGRGGNVTNNHVLLVGSTIVGGAGGADGSSREGGVGGRGGGSIYGGVSTGGLAGFVEANHSFDADGGDSGNVQYNSVEIRDTVITGAAGGTGVLGGHGGGSVFGGLSNGGMGGAPRYDLKLHPASASGGVAGNVTHNSVALHNTTLKGAKGGVSTTNVNVSGIYGHNGGSVYGGMSIGGAGGDSLEGGDGGVAWGGDAGDVTHNNVLISGKTTISENIYGGHSIGGAPSIVLDPEAKPGLGKLAHHNTVTLVGDELAVGTYADDGSYLNTGHIYGGLSLNGDGSVNEDAEFASYYQGNTLNLDGYRGQVAGIHNFENYNWVLPTDVAGGDALVQIVQGGDAVELGHTKHTVAMKSDGNRLNKGDVITLIDQVVGDPTLTTKRITQGNFIVYDATMKVEGKELQLDIAGGARLNPAAQAVLGGRSASLALVNQGADMISDYASTACKNGVFVLADGGTNRHNNGSHLKLNDSRFALGASGCFDLPDQSTLNASAFLEHGRGNYHNR